MRAEKRFLALRTNSTNRPVHQTDTHTGKLPGESNKTRIFDIIRPHRYAKHRLWVIVSDVPWSVRLRVCLSVCWSQP